MDFTYLDSNSWLIELGRKRILIDPWLVDSLVFGNLPWLFRGEKKTSRPIPENIDLILLSQGLEDHAHPPTLEQLSRHIPVVASPSAAPVVQELGYTQVTVLKHGEVYSTGRVEIKAVPGSPIGPTRVENGYVVRLDGSSLYYEPHGYHSPTLKDMAPIDVVITPIVDLKLPLLGPIIKGQQSALQICQWLQPQFILPTAAGGDVVFDGVINFLLQAEGGVEEFRDLLLKNNLSTQVIDPQPGEAFRLELRRAQRS